MCRENVCAAALDEVSSVCLLDLSVVKCGSGPVSPCWSSVWMISIAGSGAVKSCQCSAVQSLSRVRLFAAPRTVVHQASLCVTNSQSSLKLASIMLVIPSNHLTLCRPLLLPPSIFPSIGVFSNESALRIRWPKYWSFSFIISPSNEYSGLISFRMGWMDLLSVQGTLKSLLQHHTSKASILWHSAFFMVQHSHPYVTTGKTITLTRRIFVGKVINVSTFYYAV